MVRRLTSKQKYDWENYEKRQAYIKWYHQTNKSKAYHRSYDKKRWLDDSEYRKLNTLRAREHRKTDHAKQVQSAYRQTEKYKAWRRNYVKTEKHKAWLKKYRQTEKYKLLKRSYYQKETRHVNNGPTVSSNIVI